MIKHAIAYSTDASVYRKQTVNTDRWQTNQAWRELARELPVIIIGTPKPVAIVYVKGGRTILRKAVSKN